MKRLFIISALISIFGLTGCYYYGPCIDGSGPVVTEDRPATEFNAVTNTGSFEVYVTQSDSFHVEVEAQENLLPIIETYVSGYTLIIKTKDGTCFRSGAPVLVHVSLPEIEVLKLTGSGKLMADVADGDVFECLNTGSGFLGIDTVYATTMVLGNTGSGAIFVDESNVDEISMIQSGSGTIDAGFVNGASEVSIRHSSSGKVRSTLIDGIRVDAVLSGSGRIDLTGVVDVANFTLNSSGRIDALELRASDVVATSTGTGKIYVYATDFLEATITGSGDIIYRGNPTISYRITGSGSVRPY
ncbi:MAG: DUF2807 domain-containing protein [Bacteroidales bacterium]|nr:DUF2807 domain-containing protein [Bacteroidales bacterium]